VSQENVEVVLRVAVDSDVDMAQMARDDHLWARRVQAVGRYFHEDFEFTYGALPGGASSARGLEGMRTLLLDWCAPWSTYRQEVEEVIDCEDRILVLVRIFGRLAGSTREISRASAEVWTVRDGKVAGYEGYGNRAKALKAVGLEE
jgi:ketosteroid isomerase-like protein